MLHGRRPTFTLEGPFVTLRELVAGEKTFQRGHRLTRAELADLGFRDDQVEALCDAYYLDCVPEDGQTALRAQPPPAPAKTPGKRAPRAPERA